MTKNSEKIKTEYRAVQIDKIAYDKMLHFINSLPMRPKIKEFVRSAIEDKIKQLNSTKQ